MHRQLIFVALSGFQAHVLAGIPAPGGLHSTFQR